MAEMTDSPATDLRPELQLLIGCVRARTDTAGAERVRALLQGDLDWPYLIRQAQRHEVLPLVYWSLNTACPDGVPDAWLAQLRDHFRATARQNLRLAGELAKLLKLFETHGIPAIPFKGPTLAMSAYGSIALRQFADLDVVVRKKDFLQAKDLVVSRGFRPTVPPRGLPEKAYLQAISAHGFVHTETRVSVDLQWGTTIFKYFSLPVDDARLWERVGTISLAGTLVPSFAPEDLLQILCMHGSRHYWDRLKWICDVSELICAHPDLDWGQIIEQAERLGSKRMLSLGLLLSADLLGVVLPQTVWSRVRADPVSKSLAARVRQQLFAETGGPLASLGRQLIFRIQLRERLRDKVPYLLFLASQLNPNARDRAILSLPPFLAFTYYLLRPFRLAKQHGFVPLQRRLRR